MTIDEEGKEGEMTIDEETRPWWEALTLCRGKTKQNRLCRRTAMRPYEIGPGNLYTPFTCHMHWDQDAEIRAKFMEEDKHVG
ncbi:MAG: hypothetical protein DDT26_02444 [Dehalococcoidia bacterium]|nr:hypothetical protein [Chloroflexota bacterium]